MRGTFLEVTYRKGRAFAAYLHLPRPSASKVAYSREVQPALVVDFAADGTPLGIEILDPGATSPAQVQAVVAQVRAAPVAMEELAPLAA